MAAASLWTWVLFAFELLGVSGMWVVGKKKWWGWAIVLLHSIPWFIYSIIYDKPGFIAMSLLWWTINFVNMMKWRRDVPADIPLNSWLRYGYDRGYCSDVVCVTHDVLPTTEEEEQAWEDGWDPCSPGVRIWHD